MKRKSKGRAILVTLVVLAILAGVGVGIWQLTLQRSAEPVGVYPFYYIGMTEYWGDSQESYGPVTTDQVQTVYLTFTQEITQVLVQPGDMVSRGDLLMTYDTTLSDLALERERLKVEKLKLQLTDAQSELAAIKKLKPMVIQTPSPSTPNSNKGTELSEKYQFSTQTRYNGTAKTKAIICWLAGSTAIDGSLLNDLRDHAAELQGKAVPNHASASAYTAGVQAEPLTPRTGAEPMETTPSEPTESQEPSQPDVSTEPTEPSESTDPSESTQPSQPTEPSQPTQPSEPTQPTQPSEPTQPTEPSEPTEPTQPPQPEHPISSVYVIFKVTEGDMSLGDVESWQGMYIRWASGGGCTFQLFDASGITDFTRPSTGSTSTGPSVDMGSGYTAQQIAEMRTEKERQIRDLQFQIRMAEADYKIKQTEASTGEVRATISGQVVSVLTAEEAMMTAEPIIKISGGGGYRIEATIGELSRDSVQVGQTVTVNDWMSGMTYEGTIESIGDFPTQNDGWNSGNPNVSYYPLTVFVDESANLQAGSYADIMLSTATAETGIYLENPFLRTENGQSYVYVRGADGLLEQRFVTTGRIIGGSYTEILSGLSDTDYLAFPYGRTAKAGAETYEGDLAELYG